MWQTVHVNHAKLPKPHLTAFLSPTTPSAPATPPHRYSSRNLSWRKPPPPPQPAALSQSHSATRYGSPSLTFPESTHHALISQSENGLPTLSTGHRPLSEAPMKICGLSPPLRRSERLKAAAPPINRPTQARSCSFTAHHQHG